MNTQNALNFSWVETHMASIIYATYTKQQGWVLILNIQFC